MDNFIENEDSQLDLSEFEGLPLEIIEKTTWDNKNRKAKYSAYNLIIEFANGKIRGHKTIVSPDRYIEAIEKKELGLLYEKITPPESVEFIKTRITKVYAKKINGGRGNPKYCEVWNQVRSRIMPSTAMRCFRCISFFYADCFIIFKKNLEFAKIYLSTYYAFKNSFINDYWDELEKGIGDINNPKLGLCFNKNILWGEELISRFNKEYKYPLNRSDYFMNFEDKNVKEYLGFVNGYLPYVLEEDRDEFLLNDSIWYNTMQYMIDDRFCYRIFETIREKKYLEIRALKNRDSIYFANRKEIYDEFLSFFLSELRFARSYLSRFYHFDKSFILKYWEYIELGSPHYSIKTTPGDQNFSKIGLSYNENIVWDKELKEKYKSIYFDDLAFGILTNTIYDEITDSEYLQSIIPLDIERERKCYNAELAERDEYMNQIFSDYIEQGKIISEEAYHIYPRLTIDEFKFLYKRNSKILLFNNSIWNNTLRIILDQEFCEKIFEQLVKEKLYQNRYPIDSEGYYRRGNSCFTDYREADSPFWEYDY